MNLPFAGIHRTMPTAIARKLENIRLKGALTNADVANMLGLRPETISRWNQGHAFPHRESEKELLEIEYIVDELSDFYDEPNDARLWLFARQKLLNGERPADLIQQNRTDEVLLIIKQLKEAVFI